MNMNTSPSMEKNIRIRKMEMDIEREILSKKKGEELAEKFRKLKAFHNRDLSKEEIEEMRKKFYKE